MKFFNTAGPVNMPEHYKVDPLHRWDLDEILMLIAQKKYFIVHAPRQTGKTSSLLALQKKLNSEGDHICVYANFEVGQSARNDKEDGIKAIISEIYNRYKTICPGKEIDDKFKEIYNNSSSSGNILNDFLSFISEISPKLFILLIDEIDSLVGDTLISVLRQLRAGYDKRPSSFPSSVILCGVRDIKDYRIHRPNADIITGGSAFNIKAESLRLGNFSKKDVINLYNEHTKETGQNFEDGVVEYIYDITNGQPWLVNALGYEVTFKIKENRDRTITITKDMVDIAKNNLILSRATHLDQLIDKLKEKRVYSIIRPMILGEKTDAKADDEEYCIDLGLIRKTKQGFIISNDIYREVIPRELTSVIQGMFLSEFAPDWVDNRGLINSNKLFSMFRQFWRENSEIWSADIAGYKETAPHLTFQGFLQRVANGNGSVDREYGLSKRRVDLMLKWKTPEAEQRIVIELKIRTDRHNTETALEKLIAEGLEQTSAYSKISNATENHLIIFDRREKISWDEKIYEKGYDFNNSKIKIWGM